MGYTISTKVRDVGTFHAFLEGPKGIRSFKNLLLESPRFHELEDLPVPPPFSDLKLWLECDEPYCSSGAILLGKDLDYGSGLNRVGFNYSSLNLQRGYLYSLVGWAAVTNGLAEALDAAGNPTPFILIDDEKILLVHSQSAMTADSLLVDHLGHCCHKILRMGRMDEQDPAWETVDPGGTQFDRLIAEIIRQEIERLDCAYRDNVNG